MVESESRSRDVELNLRGEKKRRNGERDLPLFGEKIENLLERGVGVVASLIGESGGTGGLLATECMISSGAVVDCA